MISRISLHFCRSKWSCFEFNVSLTTRSSRRNLGLESHRKDLSIKVNHFPCLVYLHQIIDKLFILLPPKGFFLFSLNNFDSICNKSLGASGV